MITNLCCGKENRNTNLTICRLETLVILFLRRAYMFHIFEALLEANVFLRRTLKSVFWLPNFKYQ